GEGRRLVALGHGYGVDALLARRDPGEAPDEVDEIGPLHQQLRHDRVVVAGLRDVAVGADLGLGCADGVRHESAERVSAVAFGRNRLLLRIEPFAVLVLRTYQHGAGRTRRRDAMASDRPVL